MVSALYGFCEPQGNSSQWYLETLGLQYQCPRFYTPRAAKAEAKRLRRHTRSEEHTSELQSLMRISYAVFCLKKKNNKKTQITNNTTTQLYHTHNSTTHTKSKLTTQI